MVTMEYKTLVSEYVDYGRNKFLEISKKKVKSDDTVFLNISKGFYTPDGERRYQRGIGFPNEKEVVNNLIDKLRIVIDTETPVEEESTPEAAEEPSSLEEDI